MDARQRKGESRSAEHVATGMDVPGGGVNGENRIAEGMGRSEKERKRRREGRGNWAGKRHKKSPSKDKFDGLREKILAATYSPTRCPVQYHWPWRS